MHLLWKIQASMHKIIQSHLIECHSVYIKGIFVSCNKVSFFLSPTAEINILGFGNRQDKTVYKTQSHSFRKLLIVTVIVTASS